VNLGLRTAWPQTCVLPAACTIGSLHAIPVSEQQNGVDCGPLTLLNLHAMCRHLVHGGALHVDLLLPTLPRERKQRELFRTHLAQEMLDGVLDYPPAGVRFDLHQRYIGRLQYTNAGFNHSIDELLAACVVPDD
jgi:hypothetical protein